MAIKNLMVDIVTNAVHELAKTDRTVKDSCENIDDVIAYVLNRVPSKYVTSERGILHGALDSKYMVQERMDVLALIYDAVHEIKSRRLSKADNRGTGGTESLYLPHVIGTVLEGTTLSIIPDVEVTLQFKGKTTGMVYGEWENPYRSHRATRGYYHFWPKYDGKKMGKKPVFTLLFRHPKFQETTTDISLDVHSGADTGKSHVVPIILLTAREGVSLDFLYEE